MNKLEGPFILVDPDRCLGCHTCEIACAVAHTNAGNLIGAVLANELLHRRNRVVQVDGVKLSTQCRQCEDAPCVRVCPTGATYRTETITAVDQERCIGCRLCMIVCPFGAIHVGTADIRGRQKRAAFKCDLCTGRPDGPACVEACPTGALSLRYPTKIAELSSQLSSKQYLDAFASKEKFSIEKQEGK
jgi:Fe-S-cluster-containing hydrogenase component 2